MGKILIVDDEHPIREMLKKMLRHSGHDLFEACDGQEAIQRVRQDPPDLVITDIVMPEREGVETIMDIRREFPLVKIIAISGGGKGDAKNYLKMAHQLGANRAFAKPFDRTEMINAIRELLGEDPIPVQHF